MFVHIYFDYSQTFAQTCGNTNICTNIEIADICANVCAHIFWLLTNICTNICTNVWADPVSATTPSLGNIPNSLDNKPIFIGNGIMMEMLEMG